jgi:rhamnose transport system ATP-binding protein
MTPRLALDGVSKSFGGIRALKGVSFAVAPGSIHAVLGENGAGKSTLVRIVTGIEQADSGEVRLDGEPVRFASPMAARARGVVAVYQDPKLFPHLDVAENIFMGLQPLTRLGTVDRRRMYERARQLMAEVDAPIEPTATVAGLSIGEAQFVEFARAMAEGVDRLLILDEPTASLTPAETERLFRVARRLAARGVSIILISHRLEELEGLVDTVTVLRDGEHVATRPAAEVDPGTVVRLMVGRDLEQLYPEALAASDGDPGEELLRVEGLTQPGVFEQVGFSVRAGEIVALAGLVGAGRSEVAHGIMGLAEGVAGRVLVRGHEVAQRDPRRMLDLGVAYVPEDRDGEGLVTSLPVRSNLVLAVLGRLGRGGFLRRSAERAEARIWVERLQIRVVTVEQPVASLSGGNRQKVVLGKWLAARPGVLILDEPTHGIDVGTKAEVHRLMRTLTDEGLGILLISSDLPEILRMADRVLVLAEGRITAELARGEATQEAVMRAATRRTRDLAA